MKKSLVFSFGLIAIIGIVTALPLIIFAKLGLYLDRTLNTTPYLFYIGMVIATIQVYIYINKIVRIATKKFLELTK